ncbi:hypothetical protein RRG08_033202 [Elysia crispata]|uniref:Uncharacterized protein n=1 Tax=Elysia crispata TaxID=231223 RepID=A0AAE1EE22_9GAST|nr:hypothetical protein RRG08_033202 [Elysia crispata]
MQKISPSKGDLSVSSRDPRRAADNGRPRSQIVMMSHSTHCSDEEPCNHVPHSCFIVPHRCYRSRALIFSILHPLWLSPLLWSVGRVGHGVEIKPQVECFHLQNYVSGYMTRYLRFYQNS